MSTQKIPNIQKQIIQSNDGDYKGNLWSTFNIDLDSNPGTIKTSKKFTRAVDRTIDIWSGGSQFTALAIYDGRYYAINSDDGVRCSTDNDPRVQSNWTQMIGVNGDLSVFSDMVPFGDLLLISRRTDIGSFDGTTWDNEWWTDVAGGVALTAPKPHIMEVLKSGFDSLFVTNGSKINYFNADAGVTNISVDSHLTTNCLTPSLDRMWVGSYTEVGNHATVFEVQVGATNSLGDPAYNQSYAVDGRVCLAMFTYRNTPFVITDRGYIQAFNGASFETVAQFPWASESKVMEGCRPGVVQDSPTALAIHPKGAKVSGKYCYIYVNTDDEFFTGGKKINERSPSGVWVLDLETYSLTHRYALNDSYSSYGQNVADSSGPLLITNTPDTRIMVGATVAGEEGIFMESDEVNQGYFTTTRHESNSVADAFESVYVKADTLDTDETVTVKYKDVTLPNFPVTVEDITWLNATQFTTTNALTNVEVGDEVEIILGSYAGELCNITSINGGTTKTVTVDKELGTLNDTSDIQIDRYKLITDEYVEDNGEYKKMGDGKTSPSRQYKVVMKGDVTVREIISKSNSKVEL